MMRSFLIALLTLVAWTAGAQAQVVTVRGGDHPGFSRLVFYFQAGRKWDLKETDSGYLLSIDLDRLGLRLNQVFEKIGREKITDISFDRDRSTILIKTNCACPATASLLRPGMLVVDVHDDPVFAELVAATFVQGDIPANLSQPIDPHLRGEPTQSPMLPETTKTPPVPVSPRLPQPLADLPSALGRSIVVVEQPLSTREIRKLDRLTPAPETQDPRLDQTRTNVLEEILRATDQGLLISTESTDRKAPSQTVKDSESQIQNLVDGLENSRIDSSIDRGIAKNGAGPGLTANGDKCIPDQSVNISNWAVETALVENIAKFRLSLFEEFDRANRDAALGLAKTYVYLTFGAEAQSVLDRFDVDGVDADILKTMADIVDNGFAMDPGVFEGQTTCNSNVALWAALAMEQFPRAFAMDVEAIQLAFFDLPIHLRRHLGPPLAIRFLEYGDTNSAVTLRDAIDRAPGMHGDAFKLLNARIDLELGKDQKASDGFETLTRSNGSMAPDALIQRIDMAIQSHGDLPKGAVESVAALAFEYRGTEIGARLARSYVVANIVEHRFDEALSSLLRIETGEESERLVFPDLWSKLALGMARTDDDVVFLSAYYKHKKTLTGREVSKTARAKLAARLTRLGFGKDALEELAFHSDGTKSHERLLRARALVAANRFDDARSVLADDVSPEARRLLATLEEKADRYALAAEIYGDLNDLGARAQANWRAGNWDGVEDLAEPRRLTAAQLMIANEPHVLSQANASSKTSESQGIIASNEVLLTHSAWVRSTLMDLLATK